MYDVPGLFADFLADFLADAENVARVPHFDDASFIGFPVEGGRHRNRAFPEDFLNVKRNFYIGPVHIRYLMNDGVEGMVFPFMAFSPLKYGK